MGEPAGNGWLYPEVQEYRSQEHPTGKRVKILEETRAHWTSLFQRSSGVRDTSVLGGVAVKQRCKTLNRVEMVRTRKD